MDAGAEASSPSSSPSKLGHRLRTTVCGCFGGGSGASGAGAAERVRWRRRGAAAGAFRYDALSYALNFDEGGGDDDGACAADPAAAAFRYRNFNARLPPSPPAARSHQRSTAISIAIA